jgi:hypothetical protein
MTLPTTTVSVRGDHKTSFKFVFPDPRGSALGVLSLGFQPICVIFIEVEYNTVGVSLAFEVQDRRKRGRDTRGLPGR